MKNFHNPKLELIKQLTVTLDALKSKYYQSNDNILYDYIIIYQDAIHETNKQTSFKKLTKLTKLLGCAIGYLESSSNYNQNFLNEMGKSESMIKALIKSQNTKQ